MSKTIALLALASSVAVSACYPVSFTPSGSQPKWYQATTREPETVKLLSLQPDQQLYAEVGVITATDTSTEAALTRAREEAASHGCDAIFLLGADVESGPGTPGAAYGVTRNHVRASCLVERPESERKTTIKTAAKEECTPACREGFVCVHGACVSACNPLCAADEHCIATDAGPNCAK